MMIFLEIGAPFIRKPVAHRHGHIMQRFLWGWFGIGFSSMDMGQLANGLVEVAQERMSVSKTGGSDNG